MAKRSYSNARCEILNAAQQITLEEGVMDLTIDKVAEKAGKSKGGVLYHFPSKELLIKGLLDRISQQLFAKCEELYEQSEKKPGDRTRALIATFFDMPKDEEDHFYRIAGILMTVAVYHPHLLEDFKKSFQAMMTELHDDSLNPMVSVIILAAIDGLSMHRIFNLYPYDENFLQNFRQSLENLIAASVVQKIEC